MPPIRCTHVEVHLFRRRAGRIEFLALRRAGDRQLLPGVWQPVTGKIERGERPLDAAAREVREETGLVPRRWWALESVSLYHDAARGALMLLPLFAAEVGPRDVVRLSREHDAHAFLSARTAGRRYLWETQRRALAAVRGEVLAGGRLARVLEVVPRARRRVARRRPAR